MLYFVLHVLHFVLDICILSWSKVRYKRLARH